MCPNCDTAGKRLRSTLFLFCFWREKQKTKSAAVKRFAIRTIVAAFCFANAQRSRDFQSPTRGSLSGQAGSALDRGDLGSIPAAWYIYMGAYQSLLILSRC